MGLFAHAAGSRARACTASGRKRERAAKARISLNKSMEDAQALWPQVLDSARRGVRRGAPWGRHGQRPCAAASPTRGFTRAVQQGPHVPRALCAFAIFLVLAVLEFKRVAI